MIEILDNIDIIRDKILKFESEDEFYMCSILQRKKDNPLCGANENCRMLANFYIKNIEYFDRKIPLMKEYCHQHLARAYIRPQVRSCKRTNREFLKHMIDQIDNTDIAYGSLARVVIGGDHHSTRKRFILDLDNFELNKVQEIQECIINHFKETDRLNQIDNVIIIPTFNGYHIVTPGFDVRILNFYSKDFEKDTIKKDADTIIYAVKNIQQ